MTIRMLAAPLGLVALAVAGFALPGAADTGSPETTIDAFHAAVRQGEASLALSHLTRDAVVYELGHANVSREAYAKSHLAADMRAERRLDRELQGRVLEGAGDLRWSMSTYRLREGGNEWTSLETMVLRRRDGRWRIAHIHWSSRRGR